MADSAMHLAHTEAKKMATLKAALEKLDDEGIAERTRRAIDYGQRDLVKVLVEIALERADRRRALLELEESLEDASARDSR